MSIRNVTIGNSALSNIMIGSINVIKAYIGDIIIFSMDNNIVDNLQPEEVWAFTGFTSSINAVAVDNKGNVYGGGNDKTIKKISPMGEEIWRFTRHTDWIRTIAVDDDGNVYSGSDDKTIRKIQQILK